MDAEHAGIDPLVDTIDAAPAGPEHGPERVAAAVDAPASRQGGRPAMVRR
ncbi:hypothetical protein [Streptomyces sp. NPDC046942]